jgi:signal transduction histidine kinase
VLVEDPGIHTLEFLYIDDLGIEKTVLTLQIEKEKPWYLQSLFIISFIILMMIITGFISRMRIRNTERKNIKLREIIKEKTKEITDINEQLMTKVAELTQLNKINGIYISVINHDIFAPIKYINVVGDKVYEYQKRLKKEDIVNHLQLIINSTKRLEILCSNILNERSSGNSFTSVQPNISLHNMIADLQGFVKIGLQINNNELTAKIPVKAVASTSQSALNIILTNLISNANRFTKNGTISIKYSFKEQLHRIEIKDTGNGMQPDVLEKIQNRTLQVNHKDSSDLQSYGIGYSLIFKMLDIIKADMKVSSAPLKGTTVAIIFPDLPVQEISKISAS